MEMKDKLEKYWIPLGTVLLSLAITAVGNYYSDKLRTALMEQNIATMKADMAKHEMEKSEQIAHNRARADDHEQRIIRLEANFSTIQETLSEMKTDLKILIRSNKIEITPNYER